METRYDLSFMKEYAELFGIKNEQLAQKFMCGTSIVPKILSGELKLKEPIVEEIAYEFGYASYDKFKDGIMQKIANKKSILFNNKLEKILQEKKEKEKALNKEKEITVFSKFDFNNMTNKDRIIISLLCEEKLIYSINQVSNIVQAKEEYVENIYKKIKNDINNKDQVYEKKSNNELDIYSTFDFNNMTNKDRIIISLLCEENFIYSIKQVSDIVQMKEEYIKKIYEKVKYNLYCLEQEKIKTKE